VDGKQGRFSGNDNSTWVRCMKKKGLHPIDELIVFLVIALLLAVSLRLFWDAGLFGSS
jgi:hypothetical protein